jgi:hypothetical protein
MSQETLPPDLADVQPSLTEAADYERFRLARRRGVVHLLTGLPLFAFGALRLAPRIWGEDIGILASLVFAVVVIACSALVGHLRNKRKWPLIFSPQPIPRILQTMRGAIAVSVAMLLALVPLWWLLITEPPWFDPALLSSLLFAAMILSWAVALFLWGRHIGDPALRWLGVLAAPGALIPFVVPLPDPAMLAWIGLWMGGPLILLGVYRCTAPRGWLVR